MTFEFCRDITIWKMTIFDTVDYIEIESALILIILHYKTNHSENPCTGNKHEWCSFDEMDIFHVTEFSY